MKETKFLITGVGKGFGRSILECLSEDSRNTIFAITRNLDDFSPSEKLALEKKHVVFYEVDLNSEADLQKFIDNEKHILSEVDVLINNAGQRFRCCIEGFELSAIKDLFAVNVYTPMLLSKAVISGMKRRKSGRIINISSILGKSGMKDLSGYAATKGAIDSFTRSLAVEVADYGITINAIAPGFCKTSYYPKFSENHKLLSDVSSRIPMSRWGEMSELNGLLSYLISSNADYMTGQIIYIDGGWTA